MLILDSLIPFQRKRNRLKKQ